jgi:serine/threonine protein phosphatase PrpC
VRSALLRGRDHVELGSVAAEAEGPAALALSRGGAAKAYAYTDPNEDAALFATGPGGTLLAVADGHDGFAASELALDHLLHQPAAQWIAAEALDPASWERHALAALLDANAAIRREVEGSPTPRSCTTLCLAVVRPAEGRLLFATMGDSHLFAARRDGVTDHGARAHPRTRSRLGSFFLGWGEETEASLREKCVIGVEPLAGCRAVLLATDGLSERHVGVADAPGTVAACVADAARAAPELRALEAARGLVELALRAHARHGAGDNVASAVAWLE